jgi:hypothetical protein
MFSCTHDDIDEVLAPVGDGKITIQSTLDDMVITRAEVDDTTPERTITHIDIFAIDESGNIDYYERNVTGNNGGNAENGAGTLTLDVSRRAKDVNDNFIFEQGVNYKFILVANAVATKADMQEATTLSDLEKLVQDDSFETSFVGGDSSNEGATGSTPSMSRQTLLHLSGTEQGKNPDKETPQTFLMDAVATDSDNNEKWVVNPASSTVPTLNLSAEFKRAASKIIVNIKQGADVEFRTQLDSEFAQYDFYKLPASTFVLPNESKLVNIQLINTAPMKPNKETFIWKYEDASAENPRNENSIQIIGYAYSHSWSDVDLTNETSLILNIPMMWNNDDSDDHSKEAEAPRSWYKVPLSQGKKFERNKCYIVNIEINAVGAATRSTAIELRDIEYVTLDWQDVGINVGDTSENPEYLILNTDLVEMYNVNLDNTSLNFSSSSAITSVTLKDVYKQNADGTFTADTDSHSAYYINKFGIYTDLSSTVRSTISATAEQNVLNGGILILSPILNTKDEERRLAIAALGEAPEMPTAVAPPSGMPEPDLPKLTDSSSTNWEWISNNMREVTTTTTISYSYEGVGENIKFYKTTTVNKTYKKNSGNDGTTTVNGYPQTTTEEYVDNDIKQDYITAYNTWVANNADIVAAYQKYLEEMARYDAYQAALTAIQNSATSGDTHYNTIRYLEFEVKNAEGLTATFRVMQYPVIYITNKLCWFSYRDDFGGTTYLNRGTNRYVCATFNNGWGYSDNDGATNHFFASKVADNYNENTGACTLYYYRWKSSGDVYTDGSSGNTNAHYYHVHVTTSSPTYTIGIPRKDANGYTISSADNEKLVSPSFMIASQLGAVWSGKTGYDRDDAAYHCSQYVEVYKLAKYEEGALSTTINGETVYYKELRDWRLPTASEIKIIVDHQEGVAMDIVLGGGRYYSAGTSQYTSTGQDDNDQTIYTRCIRDAY